MNISIIPALSDNYFFLVGCPTTKEAALIDPSDFSAATKELEAKNFRLTKIISTHHHWDHVASNEQLKKRYNCEILGCEGDCSRIPGNPCL